MSEANMYKALRAYRVALFEQAFDDLLDKVSDYRPDPSKLQAVKAARDEAVKACKQCSMSDMVTAFAEVMPLRGD